MYVLIRSYIHGQPNADSHRTMSPDQAAHVCTEYSQLQIDDIPPPPSPSLGPFIPFFIITA